MRKVLFGVLIVASGSGFGATPENVIAEANKKAALEPSKDHFFNAAMIFDWEQSRLY